MAVWKIFVMVASVFCSCEPFLSDPNALQIIGYFDELEITNPLGAYVKKHKVGVLSFFLGNIFIPSINRNLE